MTQNQAATTNAGPVPEPFIDKPEVARRLSKEVHFAPKVRSAVDNFSSQYG